jgi:hypothetical protein
MPLCKMCRATRLLKVDAKCDDTCTVKIGDKAQFGYPPSDMNIGGGDYLTFTLCLNCGQLQGVFPLPQTALERGDDE